MIIYDIATGFPLYKISKQQDPKVFLVRKEELKSKVAWVENTKGNDWDKYKIVNNEQILKSETERSEYRTYGRFLTEEERVGIELEKQRELEQIVLKKNESEAIQTFAKMSFQMTVPSLTSTQILQFEPLVEEWVPGTYIIGNVRKHLAQVWKCVQGHTNTNNPDIAPGKSPAQWVAYKSKDIKYAKPYIQPQGAHDAYMKDEYCIFETKTYKSKIDNNVWSPNAYTAGWKEMI